MSPILFWIFVAIMLFFAGMVVLSRKRFEPSGIVYGAGRTLRVSGCVLYRRDTDPGVCRSGDGAVSFHHHAARSKGGSTQENQFPGRLRRLCGHPAVS